jgi:hypothetical protein
VQGTLTYKKNPQKIQLKSLRNSLKNKKKKKPVVVWSIGSESGSSLHKEKKNNNGTEN